MKTSNQTGEVYEEQASQEEKTRRKTQQRLFRIRLSKGTDRIAGEYAHKDIKIIVEQHSSIIEKLDEHSESLAVIKFELDTIKVATMENSHGIKPLEVGQQKLEAGQQRIEQLAYAVGSGNHKMLNTKRKGA